MILQEDKIEVDVEQLWQEPVFFVVSHLHEYLELQHVIGSFKMDFPQGPVGGRNPEETFEQLRAAVARDELDLVPFPLFLIVDGVQQVGIVYAGLFVQRRKNLVSHDCRSVKVEFQEVEDVEKTAAPSRAGRGYGPDFPVVDTGTGEMQFTQ